MPARSSAQRAFSQKWLMGMVMRIGVVTGIASCQRPYDAPVRGDWRIMGVLNVTPDSFSDGGEWFDHDAAGIPGAELIAQGATIVDVGGEATRPGAAPVKTEDELARVIPVIEAMEGASVQLSVDTSKAEVARAALAAGATFVNDVTALRGDPEMAG